MTERITPIFFVVPKTDVFSFTNILFPVRCNQRDTQDWTPGLEDSLCKTAVERLTGNSSPRHSRKEGRQSVNSDPRSGRPSTSRNEDKISQVKAVVLSDRRLTVREIAQEYHIYVGSCDEILRKDLNMRRVSAKFVPRLLTEDQQFQRRATSLSQDQEHLKKTPV
ncbi:HTH_48 domain-containing protein [Trichonephila clavipes]|nr:HTH_48 domain-containing protein [Trichonephila clavipes]